MTGEPDVLWRPDVMPHTGAAVTKFAAWLRSRRDLDFADYGALWRWSIGDPAGFWSAVWEFFDVAPGVHPAL